MRLRTVSLVLILGIVTTACSRSDTDVQAEVQKALAADSATAGITATVTDGVAKLSGITKTRAQQDRATDITRAIKGVKSVESAMQVDDAALTDEVKNAIAADESVRDIPLRIEVHSGEVKLF